MSRGRKPGFVMTDEHRDKIRNSNILNALIEHVEGRRDMSATQVSAGVALLRKVMPDLAAMEHSGNDGAPIQHVFSWKSSATKSTTSPEPSFSGSTIGPSDPQQS